MSQPGGKETTLLEAVWLLCGRGSASRYLHGWCAGPFHLTEEVLFPVMLFWLALVGHGSSSSAGLLPLMRHSSPHATLLAYLEKGNHEGAKQLEF